MQKTKITLIEKKNSQKILAIKKNQIKQYNCIVFNEESIKF